MLKKGWYIASLTLTATLGGLLFGYDTAVISGAVKSLEAFFLEGMTEDTANAITLINQYKITVSVVFCLVVLVLNSMLYKMVSVRKARIISIILLAFSLFVFWYFLSMPVDVDESVQNAIKGFTASSAIVGCILGGAFAGRLSNTIGRRSGLMLAAILFALSALGSALPDTLNFFFCKDLISFIIYRIVGGIGVGIASMLAPMYIAEIAPSGIRGKLVSWNQFAIIFGMLVIYFVNYFIALGRPQEWIDNVGWRWMFASELVPAVLFFACLLFVPETPRFLVMKGNQVKALQILERTTSKRESEGVLKTIKASFNAVDRSWLSYGGLLIFVGIMLSVFQQFVGINVVLYYAPEIFRTLGSETDTALLQTIIVGVINLLFTIIAIYTVDKYGRKILMIIGALAMAVAMLSLGTTFYQDGSGTLALMCMLVYIAGFAMSWGPVTWVLLSEIFPNSIRSAMALAVAAQWIANLMISWTFPMLNESNWLTEKFNHGFAYWIYGLMGLLAALFVWKFVPETKKRSLEQIEALWSLKK